jgi:transposase
VSISSVKCYVEKAQRGESLAPKKSPGSVPKLDEKARKLLEDDLAERPFASLRDRCEYIGGITGVSVSRSTMCRAIARIGSTRKRGRSATERDEFLRATWRVMLAGVVEPERLVFVDECGTPTSLSPIYGYASRGERLRLSVPRRRGKNTTLLSSMTLSGMGPSLAVEGATTARVFETYVEQVLAPSLKEGQMVIMNNVGAHRPKRIGELIEQRGCELIYLPA